MYVGNIFPLIILKGKIMNSPLNVNSQGNKIEGVGAETEPTLAILQKVYACFPEK